MPDTYTADSIVGSGAAVAPANGATIASVPIPQTNPQLAGEGDTSFYNVQVLTNQSGTVDTGHSAHLGLYHGTTQIGSLLSTGIANNVDVPRVSPQGDTTLSVKTTAAFAGGAIVAATIVATRVT